MKSTKDDETPFSKEELEKIILELIKETAVPNEEDFTDLQDEINKQSAVIHVKLLSGQEVVGEFHFDDDGKDDFSLYYPMRLELKPLSGETGSIRMAMELWSPFDTSVRTRFLWQHVISYGVVDETMATYHKWQWVYQSLLVKPQNKLAVEALNVQLSTSLSKDNLEWMDRLKKLRDAGRVLDYPERMQ